MGCRFREAKPKRFSSMTDPLALFDEWLAEARVSEINDPEAMALATTRVCDAIIASGKSGSFARASANHSSKRLKGSVGIFGEP